MLVSERGKRPPIWITPHKRRSDHRFGAGVRIVRPLLGLLAIQVGNGLAKQLLDPIENYLGGALQGQIEMVRRGRGLEVHLDRERPTTLRLQR